MFTLRKKKWYIEYFYNGGGIYTDEVPANKYSEAEAKRIKKLIHEKLNSERNPAVCAYAYYIKMLPFSERYGIHTRNQQVYVNKA